ncbi:MAG: sugar ABC transporter substrate-binding protein [Lachnospiraceae bacterium]
MKKKLVSILLCVSMTACLFAGCGSKQEGAEKGTEEKKEETAGTGTLEVWLPAKLNGEDEAVWDEISAPFEKEHGVDVTFQFTSWKDYESKYSSAISTKSGPDVGYMYVEMFPTYIDAGAVEDLGEYLTDEDYENYTVLGDQYKIFGKNYGIAQGGPEAVLAMFYNKEILASIEESAPETWEDVMRIAKKAKDAGKCGIAQGWGQTFYQDLNWNWYSFLYQAGGDIFDEEGKCILDEKEGVETAQFLYDLKSTENVLPEDTMSLTNSEAFEKYFLSGEAAIGFVSAGSSMFEQLKENNIDYGFTYELKGNNGSMGARASVDQLVLMSAAEDKELAFEFIKYVTGKEGGEKYHELTKSNPNMKDQKWYGVEEAEEPYTKAVGEGTIRPITAARRAPEVYDYLWKELQEMMNGSVTPEDAMKDVAEYANAMDYSAPAE